MKRVLVLLLVFGCGKSAPLDHAFESAAAVPNIRSLRIEQHGALLREQYWGGTDGDTPHDVRSVTKSVVSLLAGIADRDGCLPLDASLGATLGTEAPADAAKAAITVRELLTMSGGFQWDELGNIDEYNNWVSSPDPVRYVLARPLADPPGTYFSYDSAGYELIAVALSNACGNAADFAQAKLFGPLGIAWPQWEAFDTPPGVNGGAGVQLSTRELSTVGELVLHGGLNILASGARGGQVVPADYLAAATSVQIANGEATDFGPGYGYGFWIGPGYVMAQGYGGQFIVIDPQHDAVVAATSDWQGHAATADQTFAQLLAVITTQVLPALTGATSLGGR
ncbi:MAG TPA: serine hydrolase [Myxococcales bacterium]